MAPGPSTVPEQRKSQALSYKAVLTILKVAVASNAYPEIKFSVEHVGLVEAALLDTIISSEAIKAPRYNGIYQKRGWHLS